MSQLAEALPGVEDLPAPDPVEPRPSGPAAGAPPRGALVPPTILGGPPPSAEATAMADRILAAASPVPRSRWRLRSADGFRDLEEGVEVVIGRVASGGATIVVPASVVSKVHCRVRLERGTALVEDLGSTNGTVVRRRGKALAVDTPRALEDGDELMVLDEVVLATVCGGSA